MPLEMYSNSLSATRDADSSARIATLASLLKIRHDSYQTFDGVTVEENFANKMLADKSTVRSACRDLTGLSAWRAGLSWGFAMLE